LSRNTTAGDPIDSTHDVGSAWRTPNRTEHLAYNTVAGTEYTVGGTGESTHANVGYNTRTDTVSNTDITSAVADLGS
jgi:hypothetical protein